MMISRRHFRIALIPALALGVTLGVATQGQAEDQGKRLEAGRSYKGSDTRLLPPRASDQARVSASDAIKAAREGNGEPKSRSGSAVRVELTRFTADSFRELGTSPDQLGKRLIDDRLVWAVVTADVPQVLYGGIGTTQNERDAVAAIACDYVQIVDADTGQYLVAFQACE